LRRCVSLAPIGSQMRCGGVGRSVSATAPISTSISGQPGEDGASVVVTAVRSLRGSPGTKVAGTASVAWRGTTMSSEGTGMEDLKAAPLGSGRDGFEQMLRRRPALDQLPTPLVTLSESAIAHNQATMAAWCRSAGVQPAALTVLAPSAGRLTVWSDSSRGVEIMHEALTAAGAQEQLSVIVELGAQDGRTGVRTLEDGLEIARAISASPALRLAGVGG